MEHLSIEIVDGTQVLVPADLSTMTTYVLLEQEDWFEREMPFVRRFLRPGMTALDIGANIGIYSLVMGRLVGPTGAIHAFEPASSPRGLLLAAREANGLRHLHVHPVALSSAAGRGQLSRTGVSEIASLQADGTDGETVDISTLDDFDAAAGWASPDFVKIDAEGEEARIIDGAGAFLERHSPLIMLEAKTERVVNTQAFAGLARHGYRFYRALPDAAALVPCDISVALASFELNVLACKPDRAHALALRGLLVDAPVRWQPDSRSLPIAAVKPLRRFAYAKALPALFDPRRAIDPTYRDALVAFGRWRSRDLPLPESCGALFHAYEQLSALVAAAPTTARLATLARVAWEAGRQGDTLAALERLITADPSRIALDEPFWVPCARYDTVNPKGLLAEWFLSAAAEQYEKLRLFSSFFGPTSTNVDVLCDLPFPSAEMLRRRALCALRDGRRRRSRRGCCSRRRIIAMPCSGPEWRPGKTECRSLAFRIQADRGEAQTMINRPTACASLASATCRWRCGARVRPKT